uniref:Protein kinase domain-containing protein n=1 Tax=viral metagenome TaxID=1070528 RepID=A0A6C0D4U9_9ZZZZ
MFVKEEDLDIFLQEFRISYLTSGAFGVVFLVESETSPYVSMRNDQRINKMIIKLCGVSNHTFPLTSTIKGRRHTLKTVSERSFEREIEIQTELFFRTCEYLNPLCPCIIHSEIKHADFDAVNRRRLAPRLSHLLSKSEPDTLEYYILHFFLQQITSGTLSMYGLICMEYADGFETLYKLKKTESNETITQFESIARMKLIEMTLKTTYTHSDFHDGNILCKKGSTPEVMLIDFGLCNRLNHEEWKILKKEWDSHKYYDALESIFYPLRYDNYDLRNNMEEYGWLLGTDDIEYDEDGNFEEIDVPRDSIDKITRDIEILVEEQNLKIQQLKETFPGKFPLTQKERQKFYQFKKEAPPRYIRNQYQIQGPDAIIPQSTRVSRLYDKRVHKRTRSLNRYTLKKRSRSKSKGSREPKIVFGNESKSSKNSRSRNSAVPRGTRR